MCKFNIFVAFMDIIDGFKRAQTKDVMMYAWVTCERQHNVKDFEIFESIKKFMQHFNIEDDDAKNMQRRYYRLIEKLDKEQ